MTIADILDDSNDEDPDWLPSSLDDELDDNDHYDAVEDKIVNESTVQENDEEQVVRRPSHRQLAGNQADEQPEQGDDESGACSVGDVIEDTIEYAPNPIFALLSRGVGLLKCLSHSCHISTWASALHHVLGHVYDNINMVFKVAEQILGHKDTQENSTCTTIFPYTKLTQRTCKPPTS